VQTSVSAARRSKQRSGTDIDVSTTEPGNPRGRELERRIEELETRDEAAFGHFTAWDWTVCTVFALAVPLLGIWRCAG
jgi:hypothetical protein